MSLPAVVAAPEAGAMTDIDPQDYYGSPELADIGRSLLGWVAATRAGRWRGPRGALDYVDPQTGADRLVQDFIAWASGYSDDLIPGARKRMEMVGNHIAAETAKTGQAS